MQTVLEIRTINNQSKKLILFFADWGMDEKACSHLWGKDYDIITIFNYTDFYLDICKAVNCRQWMMYNTCPIYRTFCKYSDIYIVAYGAGVWASSLIFSKYLKHLESKGKFSIIRLLKKIKSAVAINGTLSPVSNIWGIKQKIFNSTAEALGREVEKLSESRTSCSSSSFWNKYYGRVFNNNLQLQERYLSNTPLRGTEDVYNELLAMKEQYIFSNGISWNKVIISRQDHIVPTSNQKRFWCEYQVCLDKENRLTFNADDFSIRFIDAQQFPFYNWSSWSDIL